MKILFLCLYFPPARYYGGPLVSALAMCRAWLRLGVSVDVVTTNADGPTRKIESGSVRCEGMNISYARTVRELFAPCWPWLFVRRAIEADYVYVWGIMVWLLPFVVLICRLLEKRLVVSPRGMLLPSALSIRSWRKRWFIRALKIAGIVGAGSFHATSEDEVRSIEAFFPKAKVVVAPNGVDIPAGVVRSTDSQKYVLFFGRIHPIKRIEILIEAFASIHPGVRSKYMLRIVGAGDPQYAERLSALAHGLHVAREVQFADPVFGDAKDAALSNAAVLVLPSASENFGMAVAEALAHGTPVIATVNSPWSDLESKGCGWWVGDGVDALKSALETALTLPDAELAAMGLRGRRWMEESFSWSSTAKALLAVCG